MPRSVAKCNASIISAPSNWQTGHLATKPVGRLSNPRASRPSKVKTFTTRMVTRGITPGKTWLLAQSKRIGRKISVENEARRQCTHELKALLHRWEEESDLNSEEIVECVEDAVSEYYDEDIVDFKPDINGVDGEVDLGETEEGG